MKDSISKFVVQPSQPWLYYTRSLVQTHVSFERSQGWHHRHQNPRGQKPDPHLLQGRRDQAVGPEQDHYHTDAQSPFSGFQCARQGGNNSLQRKKKIAISLKGLCFDLCQSLAYSLRAVLLHFTDKKKTPMIISISIKHAVLLLTPTQRMLPKSARGFLIIVILLQISALLQFYHFAEWKTLFFTNS